VFGLEGREGEMTYLVRYENAGTVFMFVSKPLDILARGEWWVFLAA
jgi:hypothetical protein